MIKQAIPAIETLVDDLELAYTTDGNGVMELLASPNKAALLLASASVTLTEIMSVDKSVRTHQSKAMMGNLNQHRG